MGVRVRLRWRGCWVAREAVRCPGGGVLVLRVTVMRGSCLGRRGQSGREEAVSMAGDGECEWWDE